MTEITSIRCGFVNCYILKNGDRALLVDAANAGDADKILRGLALANLAPRNLEMLFLTHRHPDHMGCAALLHERYGVPLAFSPREAGPAPAPLRGRGVRGTALLVVSRGAVAKQQPLVQPDIPLEDGMDLAPYGIDGRVIGLPGHTAGSLGLLLGDGRLVAGDMYMNFLKPHTAHIAEDFPTLRETSQWLAMQGVTTVYPGHGKPFDFTRYAPIP